jgi:hypothetical protein
MSINDEPQRRRHIMIIDADAHLIEGAPSA